MLGTHINFFYYSGTGNTYLVVKKMTEVFSARGIKVTLHKIEHIDPAEINTEETIGLAFPVAFQSTFPFMWEFFKALPRSESTPIFMVDTMMAFSGAMLGPLKKVLTSKGFKCIGAREIIMPNNWFPKKTNEEMNREKINKGLEIAKEFAEDLIEGKTSWGRIPFLSDGLYHLCSNSFMMNRVNLADGRRITLDKSKCTKCGICAKLCPKNNIIMKEFPEWLNSCEICMRCLSFCSTKAVLIPGKRFSRYRAVQTKELLKEIK